MLSSVPSEPPNHLALRAYLRLAVLHLFFPLRILMPSSPLFLPPTNRVIPSEARDLLFGSSSLLLGRTACRRFPRRFPGVTRR